MSAVAALVRNQVRARLVATLVLALLLGGAGGIVLAAAAGARRTDTALSRFFAVNRPYDVQLAPSVGRSGDQPLDLDRLRHLPEVAASSVLGYLFMQPLTPSGTLDFRHVVVPFANFDANFGVTVSRPKLVSGRLPAPDRAEEIATNDVLARQRHLHVGDHLTLGALTRDQMFAATSSAFDLSGLVPAGPHVTFTVVGITRQPRDISPVDDANRDAAYLGHGVVYATPAFVHAYAGRVGGTGGVQDGAGILVRLKRGAADLPAFRSDVERLPGAQSLQFRPGATEEAASARRAMRVEAVAAGLFSALAAAATLLVVGQILSRQLHLDASEYPTLAALGLTPAQLFIPAMLRVALVAVMGAIMAVGVAVCLSPLTPFGLARLAEPHQGLAVNAGLLGLSGLLLVAAVLARAALPAWRLARWAPAGRRLGSQREHFSAGSDLVGRLGLPATAVVGVRRVLGGGRDRTGTSVGTTVSGAAVAIAVLVGSISVGQSLDRLVRTPRLYGWTWDAVVGNPNALDLTEQVVPRLDADPDLGAFSSAALKTSITLGGIRVDAVGIATLKGQVLPPVIAGRQPQSPDEVLVGTTTLGRLHARIGQSVVAGFANHEQRLRIVGTGVIPGAIAPNDGLGDGALLTLAGLKALVPQAQTSVFFVRFAPNIDRHAAYDRLRAIFPFQVLGPLRPAGVESLHRVRDLPFVFAALVVGLALAIVVHTLVTSVRHGRRDLAILKTLGLAPAQVRATVAWEATTFAVMAAAVGLPVGIVAGGRSWMLLGRQLGVVVQGASPWLAVVLVSVGTVVLANLAALGPAWAAGSVRPAEALRIE